MEERIGLSELAEEQRQQAMERFHILRPFFEEVVPLPESPGYNPSRSGRCGGGFTFSGSMDW